MSIRTKFPEIYQRMINLILSPKPFFQISTFLKQFEGKNLQIILDYFDGIIEIIESNK